MSQQVAQTYLSDAEPTGKGELAWVTAGWLKERLDDGKYFMLDVQPDIHDYLKGHLPGAVFMHQECMRLSLEGNPGMWIDPKMASFIFGRLGLDPAVPVVVYSGRGLLSHWGDGLEQTMVCYSLLRYGHSRVFLLEGGLDNWMAHKFPVTREFPKVTSTTYPVEVRSKMFIGMDELKEIMDEPNVLLLDSRPRRMYEGDGPWIRNGHIPGAVCLPWRTLMARSNPNMLKPVDEIRQMLQDSGATEDKTIICYCGTGREATNEYLILKHLFGYSQVRLYEGAFTEWSSYPDNKVNTGPQP